MSTRDDGGRTHATETRQGIRTHRALELATALPLSIVAIIGVYFTADEYFSGRPKVAVDFVSGELRAEPIAEDIVLGLEKIERDFSDITGSVIIDLISGSHRLEDATSEGLREFRYLLNEQISMFDVESLVNDLMMLEDDVRQGSVSEVVPKSRAG